MLEREKQRIAELYGQLAQLETRTHPLLLEKLDQFQSNNEDEITREEIAYELTKQRIDFEYSRQMQLLESELDKKKRELMEAMLKDLDEEEKRVAMECQNLEIGRADVTVCVDGNKKTRRGGGVLIEPPTYFNATPKPAVNITASSLGVLYLLSDAEIAADVRALTGEKRSPEKAHRMYDVTMNKQKLLVDGKSYKVGEEVYVENLEYGKIPAKIDQMNEMVVSFKSILGLWDTRQVHASLADLSEGRVQISKKRNN